MAALRCYRCGGSLEALSLPLARLDLCPDCGVELHVCRMCTRYAPSEPDQCAEEDAIEVRDKTAANFCDYFSPSAEAFDEQSFAADRQARDKLASLFGEAPPGGESAPRDPRPEGSDDGDATRDALDRANALFKD